MTINVVYLAYFNESIGYNIDIVESFLNSYKTKSAGIKHSLTIIVKNCTNRVSFDRVCCLVEELNARIIELPDDGWDFGAYFRVAKVIEGEYVFFCGTYLLIKSENWLLNFYNAFNNDDSIQLAGPMGSWGDSKLERFPNYHIRTTAFMLKRQLFLEYISTQKFPVEKEDTYGFEHGENSLTNFVLNKGYKAVVVDCEGKVFAPENWDESKTFRNPEASKSIFTDRHTAAYDIVEPSHREMLERAAWGRSLAKTKIKIFVAYDKEDSFFASEVFQPIHNGACDCISGLPALKDNIGDNISSKYNRYQELTGHYWVWKNLLPRLDTEYIGFCLNDRFLDFNILKADDVPFNNTMIFNFKKIFTQYTEENILKLIQNYDVAVPQKFVSPKSIYELYLDSSPKEELDLALNILNEIYPEYVDAAQKILRGNELYACLIFIMKKELIAEYMEWIFSILTILEQRIDWNKYDESLNNDIFINIAEIFFNIWLCHSINTKGLKVIETTSVLVDKDISNFLQQYIAETK